MTLRPCLLSATSLLTTVALASPTMAQSGELPEDYGGFVSVEGTELRLNGGKFAFSGANSYAMLYSEEQAEEQMRIARDLGLNTIRMWGFWDGDKPTLDQNGNVIEDAPGGTDQWGRAVLQSAPREYNEAGFLKLDHAIYLAHIYGMKLIIPLLNEWDEFGGLKQYLKWAELEVPEEKEGFYTNEEAIKAQRYQFFESQVARDIYLDYVQQVLTRVNSITGVAYKDDPAIMIWEVMNEPRFGPWLEDPTAETVRDFLKESAEFIKSIDDNHLVGTGEEGFLTEEDIAGTSLRGYAWTAAAGEGSSFRLNSEIEAIDVLTFHGWPFNWAMAADAYIGRIEEFMPEWIEEHAKIAQEVGKPLYLGEFGWQILRREGSDVAERDAIMRPAYLAAKEHNLAGIAYWHITESHTPSESRYEGEMERTVLDSAIYNDTVVPHDQEFRFDIYCPEDESTCDLIKEFTADVTALVEVPDPPFTGICLETSRVCADACVNLDRDRQHCGECGNVCSANETCRAGSCIQITGSRQWGEESTPYDTEASCSATSPGRKSGSSWLFSLAPLLLLGASRHIGIRRRRTSREFR